MKEEDTTVKLDYIFKIIEQFVNSQNVISGSIKKVYLGVESTVGETFSLELNNKTLNSFLEGLTADYLTNEATVDPFDTPELAPTDSAGKNTNGARFGCSRNSNTKWHGGLDLKATVGTDVRAIYSGEVTSIRNRATTDPDYYADDVGNYVIVKTAKGFSYKYCHLSTVDVFKGNFIKQNSIICKSGDSGNAEKVPFKHLHIEISTDHFATNKSYVDPEPYIKTKFGPNPNPINC